MLKWREFAFDAARAKGARRACDFCKRAMLGCGLIEVRPPFPSIRSRRTRSVCTECYRMTLAWMDEQEYNLDNYDLPIDVVSGSRYIKRGKEDTNADTEPTTKS